MVLGEKEAKALIERISEMILKDENGVLNRICQLLKDSVDHYNWVGIYIKDPERKRELVLGPYAGDPTEHTRISFGDGICGQAAETGKLFLIPDVTREDNYLSCSPKVLSEIILPIFIDGEFIGELDIDSHSRNPFTDHDVRLLERICRLITPLL